MAFRKACLAAAVFAASTAASATIFTGNLYYTHFQGGGDNVLRVGFNYDDATQTVSYGPQTGIASVNGADGIVFAPNGNLLVTSNSVGSVYRLDPSTGNLLQTVATGGPADFHMAIDPTGTAMYSSDRYTRTSGPLDTFAIAANGSLSNATTTTISGDDPNVTQLAFAPNGRVMYTDGTPNRLGSIGLFTFGSPDTTVQLVAAGVVPAAHGIIYDPFTGLMTMFGGGEVATMDPAGASNADILNSLSQYDVPGVDDFDQGAVDGAGHAFIAGSGAITFIDYHLSHDITKPDKVIVTGGFGDIDDIAPLVGLGAPPSVPEPGTLALIGLGAAALALRRRPKA